MCKKKTKMTDAFNPLIPWVITLAVFVFLAGQGIKGYLISNVILLALFLFTLAVLNPVQGTFYTVMILGVFVLNGVGFVLKERSGVDFFGQKYTGYGKSLIILLVGVGITLGFRQVAGAGSASIIGVPQSLAVSSGVVSALTPTLVSVLGYVENRFFMSLGVVSLALISITPLALFGPLAFTVLPIVIASTAFALFHLAVFQVSGLLFAFTVFMIWSAVATFTKLGLEVANVSHFVHNGLETLPLAVST